MNLEINTSGLVMMSSVTQASPFSFSIFSVWLTFSRMPHGCIIAANGPAITYTFQAEKK